MKMVQCPQGHLYDTDVNKTCPICAGNVASVSFNANPNGFVADSIGATTPLNYAQANSFTPQGMNVTEPVNPVPEFVPEVIDATTSTDQFNDEETGESARPVCGWLVCIEGAKKGRSYEIYPGYTRVGRAEDNDVALSFDSTISSHAIAISYDHEDNQFGIGLKDSTNIIKINGKSLLSQLELNDGDIIKLGDSKFIFRALCNEAFRWDFE